MKNLVFAPKIQDSTIKSCIDHLDVAFIDAPHILWRPKIIDEVGPIVDDIFIDPMTNKLLFPNGWNDNYKKLPYVEEIEMQEVSSNHTLRVSLIEKVVNFQIENGATALIAPYFYSENVEDRKFNLNLQLLSETVIFLKEKKIKLPLFGMINLGIQVFENTGSRSLLIDRYSEDKEALAGFVVMASDFDDRKANYDSLEGLAYLIYQLSKEKQIFIKRIGGFGDIIAAIAGTGFSSGLGEGDTFQIKSFHEKNNFPGRGKEIIYVPEFFDYINISALEKISYFCNCSACKGKIAKTIPEQRVHFLLSKMERMKKLRGLDRAGRIDYIKKLLIQAEENVKKAKRTFPSPAWNDKHIYAWIRVLDSSKNWIYEEDSKDLEDELLKKLSESLTK